jgi:hypothetical protein
MSDRLTVFEVRLSDLEAEVLFGFMQACGLSTVNAALRTALFTQCRLSEIAMPTGCFGLSAPKSKPVERAAV